MDTKLFTEFLQKNDPSKNIAFMEDSFLAPLAEGQRAIVMAWGRRASVRLSVRPCVRP